MAELVIRTAEMRSESIRAQEKEAADVRRRMPMLELAGRNDYCY